MTINERIKFLRKQQNSTLEEIGKRVGVSRQTIQRYESGVINDIPSDKIEKLAIALNTTPAFLMGWTDTPDDYAPNITNDYVTYPVIGDIAAGYDSIAVENWEGDTIDIPKSYLKGHAESDFFVLAVSGSSMLPQYMDGDRILVLKQTTCDYSGQIAAVMYNGECATLKRVVYVQGEDWMELQPLNYNYPTVRITDADLTKCRVLGIPKLLVREI